MEIVVTAIIILTSSSKIVGYHFKVKLVAISSNLNDYIDTSISNFLWEM